MRSRLGAPEGDRYYDLPEINIYGDGSGDLNTAGKKESELIRRYLPWVLVGGVALVFALRRGKRAR